MEGLYHWIGFIAVVLFVIYLVLLLLSFIYKQDEDPIVDDSEMPVMRPLPIPTFNESYIGRVLAWVLAIRKWKLEEDWEYTLNKDSEDEVTIFIEAGFEFDGASIPKPLWGILSPVGLLLIPGLIHDYGYRHDYLWEIKSTEKSLYMKGAGRGAWDKLFKDVGMAINGFTLINYAAWVGVWAGGRYTWWRYKQDRIRAERAHRAAQVEERP